MPLVYEMPSLDRAVYVAAILVRHQVQAREEMRSGRPVLVVEDHSPLIEAAVERIEPQAELILPHEG